MFYEILHDVVLLLLMLFFFYLTPESCPYTPVFYVLEIKTFLPPSWQCFNHLLPQHHSKQNQDLLTHPLTSPVTTSPSVAACSQVQGLVATETVATLCAFVFLKPKERQWESYFVITKLWVVGERNVCICVYVCVCVH